MPKNRHVLLGFLGKGVKSRTRPGYEQATYDFGDGRVEVARVFGVALLRFLQSAGSDRPDRLVMLGTTGSDWDLLYDELGLLTDGSVHAVEVLENAAALSSASATDAVSHEQVRLLSEHIGKALGLECRCVIVPYGDEGEDQFDILRVLSHQVEPEELVTLDLTHGLRHLPILGLVSALYLKAAKRASIRAVYYGALDMRARHKEGYAPVLRLDGLLDIAEWVQALQTFDKDADYSVFAPLLRKDGVEHEALAALRRAAFLERTARIGEARTALNEFRKKAGNLSQVVGPTSLFAVNLQARLAWAEAPGLYHRQKQLAWLHLEHRDYLRAALFGLEAFLTRLTHESGRDVNNQIDREASVDAFVELVDRTRTTEHPLSDAEKETLRQGLAFHPMKAFRNAVVHVDNPRSGKVVEALKSEEKTRNALSSWMQELLPEKRE